MKRTRNMEDEINHKFHNIDLDDNPYPNSNLTFVWDEYKKILNEFLLPANGKKLKLDEQIVSAFSEPEIQGTFKSLTLDIQNFLYKYVIPTWKKIGVKCI